MLSVALVVTLSAAPAELKWSPVIDLSATGTMAVGWFVSELALKKPLAPTQCRWCATNDFDDGVRRLFNPNLASSPNGIAGADMASNIVGFGMTPLGILGIHALVARLDDSFVRYWPVDFLLISEATVAAALFNQVVKFAVGRGRPYSVGATPGTLKDVHDSNLSFFSGHATFAFALATSAGTVASMRGYRYAWLVWAVGIPLAVTTSVLRVAADKHWTSDILVGMGVGTLLGVGIPWLFHSRVPALQHATISVSPNGVLVSGQF